MDCIEEGAAERSAIRFEPGGGVKPGGSIPPLSSKEKKTKKTLSHMEVMLKYHIRKKRGLRSKVLHS